MKKEKKKQYTINETNITHSRQPPTIELVIKIQLPNIIPASTLHMLWPPVKLYANAPAMIFIDDHHNTSFAFYGTLPNPIFIVTISADDIASHVLIVTASSW